MSSPIEIPTRSRGQQRSSPSASPSGSPGLYVPVHRRAHSPASFSASSSRSGRSTPDSLHDDHTLPVYSIHELLHLARSPMAKLAPETKRAIRDAVPDIVLNRKAAETRRWKARQAPSPERADHHRDYHHHPSSPSASSGEWTHVSHRRW